MVCKQNNRSATVWIGRITCKCNIDRSIKNATKYLGRPYDYYFMPDDKEIYCSELVQKSFINDAGKLIFHPIPMSFHDSKGHITHYWQRYYMKRHLKVPEGEPGSNFQMSFHTLMSQIDLMPTVFGLLHFHYTSHFFGQNVLSSTYHPRAFAATYQNLGYIENGKMIVLSAGHRQQEYRLSHTKLRKE